MEGRLNVGTFWKNKRVLITGANGFLGSHLSLRLIKEGSIVVGIIKEDIRPCFLLISKSEDYTKRKMKIIKINIAKFNKVIKIFKDYTFDICFHIAAQPIVGIANNSPVATFETNIKGTWNILEAARLFTTKAIVVASSDKAYGEHKKLPYKEDASLLALHPYDASKACADILARVYAHTYGLNTAVTRCANIYGPGDFNFSRIIPDTIRSVILGKNPVIRSDGTPLRDYIYIDDVIEAYLILARKLYQQQIPEGEAFNFGTGKPISVNSLFKVIARLCSRPEAVAKVLGAARNEIDRQFLAIDKAKTMLHWVPCYTLEEGLECTIVWYKEYLHI